LPARSAPETDLAVRVDFQGETPHNGPFRVANDRMNSGVP
jgi:hypothetical protein